MEVYLDNSATTKPYDEALSEMCRVAAECYGNPSSLHRFGKKAEDLLESSRHTVASQIDCKDGELYFSYTASAEGEYFVRVYQNGTQITQLNIYALAKDLSCRYPLRGDFHVHTNGSDGQESAPIVCANYRKKLGTVSFYVFVVTMKVFHIYSFPISYL